MCLYNLFFHLEELDILNYIDCRMFFGFRENHSLDDSILSSNSSQYEDLKNVL